MAADFALPPEQQASYTVIIDGILATADLNTISAKQIRAGLQKAVQYDITPQKDAIKTLIMQRFDKFHAELETKAAAQSVEPIETVETVEPAEDVKPVANGKADSSSASPTASKRKAETEEPESSLDSATPPPKKKVRKSDDMDADAALAAKLQAEENARSRPTRGGSSRKAAPAPKKKAKKKKSKSKVNAEDDSDVEGSGTERNVNRNSGFHKPLILSTPLSELLNETKLSRPQATKKLWAYIKSNDLQDPSDRRMIRCDELMKAVFKTDVINMFKMTKAMSLNMYNEGE